MEIGQLLVQILGGKKKKKGTFLDSHLKNSGVKYRSTKTDSIATRWNT